MAVSQSFLVLGQGNPRRFLCLALTLAYAELRRSTSYISLSKLRFRRGAQFENPLKRGLFNGRVLEM